MGTVIICIILVAICIFAVWSYRKKLKNGCCGSGGEEEKRLRPQDEDLSHYPYEYQIQIEGMTCKNCAMHIQNRFNQQQSFYAEVSFKKNTATVHTKQPVPEDELKLVIRQAGYTPLFVTQIQ